MISKYHNHTLQTNTRHHEEEPQDTNSYKTSGRKLKQSNQLSVFLVKVIAKLDRTHSNANQDQVL